MGTWCPGRGGGGDLFPIPDFRSFQFGTPQLAEGIYLYEAASYRLAPAVAGDHRAKASRRSGAGAKAPVSLIFVADIAKFAKAPFQEPGLRDPEIQKSYYHVATGLIAGNVYLFAAAQGLAA